MVPVEVPSMQHGRRYASDQVLHLKTTDLECDECICCNIAFYTKYLYMVVSQLILLDSSPPWSQCQNYMNRTHSEQYYCSNLDGLLSTTDIALNLWGADCTELLTRAASKAALHSPLPCVRHMAGCAC